MREQCPLTRAVAGFVCTHNLTDVLGTGGNDFNTWSSVPIVPTLYPLQIVMCGNSPISCHIRLSSPLSCLVPTVPTCLVLDVRAQGWGKVPYSVALCLLLAGVTRLLVPRLHRPIPVRSAGRPMPSPPSPAASPCAVVASCPCLSADNPPQGIGAPHVWDLVLW